MAANNLFDKMVNEATEEVASKGWKKADQNAVTLAAFGMLNKAIKNRMHSITKPFWWASGAIGTGVLWFIISGILELALG